jgi:hypothetical protein
MYEPIDFESIIKEVADRNRKKALRQSLPQEAAREETALGIRKLYRKHRMLARLAAQTDLELFETLKLYELRFTDPVSEMGHAVRFYNRVMAEAENDFFEKMETFGVTREELELSRKRAVKLEESKYWQKKVSADYWIKEQKKMESLRDLNEFFADMEPMAREALEGRPDLMKEMGLKPEPDASKKPKKGKIKNIK